MNDNSIHAFISREDEKAFFNRSKIRTRDIDKLKHILGARKISFIQILEFQLKKIKISNAKLLTKLGICKFSTLKAFVFTAANRENMVSFNKQEKHMGVPTN